MARYAYEELGRRLRLLRIRLENERGERVTQGDVAEELGVAEHTVTAWEIGRQRPGEDNLEALTKLYHTTRTYILDGHGDPGDRELELEAAIEDIQGILDRVRRDVSGKASKRRVFPSDQERAVGE